MAHLGSDVAAFVDGQLPEPAMDAVRRHLDQCEDCRLAVRQQKLLKSRMRYVNAPEPPDELLLNLNHLQDHDGQDCAEVTESAWSRLRNCAPVRITIALAGASALVMVAGYVMGTSGGEDSDPVSPLVEDFALAFSGSARPQIHSVSNAISTAHIDRLSDSGWPCHRLLGQRFRRTDVALVHSGQIVDLTYSDGTHSLKLFEQSGALDPTGLRGFEPVSVGHTQVWLRAGQPLIAVWDSAGMVFTVVTDATPAALAAVMADLPTPSRPDGTLDRVGNGLSRMAGWFGAA